MKYSPQDILGFFQDITTDQQILDPEIQPGQATAGFHRKGTFTVANREVELVLKGGAGCNKGGLLQRYNPVGITGFMTVKGIPTLIFTAVFAFPQGKAIAKLRIEEIDLLCTNTEIVAQGLEAVRAFSAEWESFLAARV